MYGYNSYLICQQYEFRYVRIYIQTPIFPQSKRREIRDQGFLVSNG